MLEHYQCIICPERYKDAKDFLKHYTIHEIQEWKPEKDQQKECQSDENLKIELEAQNQIESNNKRESCDKSFGRRCNSKQLALAGLRPATARGCV